MLAKILLPVFLIAGSFSFGEEAKCQRGGNCSLPFEIEEEPKLKVFASFSMPEPLFLELSKTLEKTGGIFLLRGVPENSVKKFVEKVLLLRKQGVKTPFSVDPESFEKYQISEVPTFLVEEEEHFDLMPGNVTPRFVLETFSKKGETKTLSKKLLQKLEGRK